MTLMKFDIIAHRMGPIDNLGDGNGGGGGSDGGGPGEDDGGSPWFAGYHPISVAKMSKRWGEALYNGQHLVWDDVWDHLHEQTASYSSVSYQETGEGFFGMGTASVDIHEHDMYLDHIENPVSWCEMGTASNKDQWATRFFFRFNYFEYDTPILKLMIGPASVPEEFDSCFKIYYQNYGYTSASWVDPSTLTAASNMINVSAPQYRTIYVPLINVEQFEAVNGGLVVIWNGNDTVLPSDVYEPIEIITHASMEDTRYTYVRSGTTFNRIHLRGDMNF